MKIAKSLILGAAKSTGVFEIALNSRWRSRRLLILAYHGISLEDEHEWDGAFYMPQDLFRRRMALLRAGGYSVLPLEEAVERLYANDLPPHAVTLTFDDGMRDFRVRACPVLAEFSYPATVYLTTYFSVHRYPVFNVFFSYLLWKGGDRTVDLTGVAPGLSRHALPRDRAEILRRIREFRDKTDPGNEELCAIARALAQVVGEDYDRLCELGFLHVMTPAQVSELPRFGVTIQLHTHRHRTPDDEQLFRREIRDNRTWIASMGVPAERLIHFCYPNGRRRTAFFPWLKAEGVKTATTCVPGLASRRSLPLDLPRLIDTCNISTLEFEGWLTGTSEFMPRRTAQS